MNKTATKAVSRFFTGLENEWCLIFTTFGLDEAVFSQLLEFDPGAAKRHLFVFFDGSRHRNPGFALRKYRDVKLRPVFLEVPKLQKQYDCPVFHSKVWIALDRSKRIRRIAVLSANLTRMHFDENTSVWDTFWMASGLSLPLPKSAVFAHLSKNKPIERVRLKGAETWLIDGRTGRDVSFCVSPLSAGDIIREKLQNVSPTNLAAPFVTKSVVNVLAPIKLVDVRTGHSSKGEAIHAKLICSKTLTVAGSPNLTCQAMRFSDNPSRLNAQPINHEAILLLNGRNPATKLLARFVKPTFKTQDGGESPGDNEGDIQDWKLAIDSASNAPDEVQFRAESDTHFGLELSTVPAKTKWIRVRSGDISEPSVRIDVKGRFVTPSPSERSQFIKLLLNPPCFVEGFRPGKLTYFWQKEVNLTDLWDVVIENGNRKKEAGGTTRKGTKKKKLNSEPNDQRPVDLRELRDQMLTPSATDDLLYRILLRFHPDYQKFKELPEWVLDLRRDVKERVNGKA